MIDTVYTILLNFILILLERKTNRKEYVREISIKEFKSKLKNCKIMYKVNDIFYAIKRFRIVNIYNETLLLFLSLF